MSSRRFRIVLALSSAFALFGLLLVACPTAVRESCDYNGRNIAIGAEFIADDGCNLCTCVAAGEVECTDNSCGGDGDGDVSGDGDGDGDTAGDGDGDMTGDGDGDGDALEHCEDIDGDGFYVCEEGYENPGEEDCDDFRWYVQPGGWEYPDNEIDDNCNGLIDAEERAPCECPGEGANSGEAIMAAMGHCDETIVSISRTGNAGQFGVFPDYYGDVQPLEGDCLAVMSSGNADGSDSTGENFGDFSCTFDDPDPNATNDGSDDFFFSDGVCNLATLTLTLKPPTNAKGFEFDFMFLSTEWPEFLCLSYNDTFYTITETQAVNNGSKANVSYDPEGRPITVNVGFFELPREWTTPLDNTPYGAASGYSQSCPFPSGNCVPPDYCDNHAPGGLDFNGSGSGWLTTRAPVLPGEDEITVKFTIHDEADASYDSSVILDRFRWTPYEPEVGTVKEVPEDDPFDDFDWPF